MSRDNDPCGVTAVRQPGSVSHVSRKGRVWDEIEERAGVDGCVAGKTSAHGKERLAGKGGAGEDRLTPSRG